MKKDQEDSKEFLDRDWEVIESDLLPPGKKIVECSFCNRPVGNEYGLDLLGRTYCHRRSCEPITWIKENIINRYKRLKKAW